MSLTIIMFILLFVVITLRNVLIAHHDAFMDPSTYMMRPRGSCLEYGKGLDNKHLNILTDMEIYVDQQNPAERMCVLPHDVLSIYSTRGGRNKIDPETCELNGKTAYGKPVKLYMTPVADNPKGCAISLDDGMLDDLHEIKMHDYIKEKLDIEATLKKRVNKLNAEASKQEKRSPECRMAWTSDYGKNTGQPNLRRFANLPLSCEKGELITRVLPPELEGISYECCKVDDTGLTKESTTSHSTGWFNPLNWNDISLLQHKIDCGGDGGLQQFYVNAKDETSPSEPPQVRINYTCAHFSDGDFQATCEEKPRRAQAWGEMQCATADGSKGYINQIQPNLKGVANVQFDYKCCVPNNFRQVK